MSQQKTQSVQTTGHVWDDDLQEYSNPLPSWWLMGFYASVLMSLIYWMIYPTWPVGKHFTTGFSTVTYVNDKGQEKSWHWNTRAQLMKDMNEAEKMQKPYFDKVSPTWRMTTGSMAAPTQRFRKPLPKGVTATCLLSRKC